MKLILKRKKVKSLVVLCTIGKVNLKSLLRPLMFPWLLERQKRENRLSELWSEFDYLMSGLHLIKRNFWSYCHKDVLQKSFNGVTIKYTVLRYKSTVTGERTMINNIELRRYEVRDIPEIVNIWNEVVKEGNAFPQILQFNAVVESNMHAIHLYERIGFKQLGVIPNGFKMDEGKYENICVYYIEV